MRIYAPTGKRIVIPSGKRGIARDLTGVLPDRAGLRFAAPLRRGVKAAPWSKGIARYQAPNPPAVDVDGSYFPWQGGGLKRATLNEPRFGGFNEATRDKGVLLEATEANDASDFDAWTERGTATLTGGQNDPFGGTSAYLIDGLGTPGNDILQSGVITGKTEDDKLSAGILVHPNGKAGTVRIINQTDAAKGRWDIDLSALSQQWHWIANDHAAVTVVQEFRAAASGAAGLQIFVGSGDCDCLVFWPNLIDSGRYTIGSPIAPAATRAVDAMVYANDDDENAAPEAGSAYLAYTPQADGTDLLKAEVTLLDTRDVGNNDGVQIYVSNTSGTIKVKVRSGGATTLSVESTTTVVRGTTYIICVVWDGNDLRLYVNGVEEDSANSGAAPTAMGDISLRSATSTGRVPEGVVSLYHVYGTAHAAARAVRNSNVLTSWAA